MLKASVTPTRLVDPATRPNVPILDPQPPSRFRGWKVAAAFGRLGVVLASLWVRRHLTKREAAQRLRELFEDMGGLWIKAGQLLALRIDIFPAEMCEELSKLQSRAIGFPGQLARQIVEQELGGPVDRFFDEFNEVPFAAASIGQVHRARLRREQRWVAVKVQKPYSAELFSRDIVFIEWVVWILHALRIYRHMRWKEGVEELRQIMTEELDFDYEASSMRRMRRTLRRHGIYVPRVYLDYCTRRVLVSEFIHAVLMADFIRVAREDPECIDQWVRENNVDRRLLARRMINSLFRQLFEDNLYHGDMHPGNIVLLRNSRIALIDFGTTNFTENEYLHKFEMFARALATRDYSKAADLCFMLCAVLPHFDIEQVKDKVVRTIRAWATRTLVKQLPYHEKSIDNATIEIMKVLVGYKCAMDWAWLRIHRATSTLDASLIYLYPDINYTRTVQRYFRKKDRRELKQLMGPAMAARGLRGIKKGLDIQDRIDEYTMFQGSLIRRHAQVFEVASDKFAEVVASALGLVALALVLPFAAQLIVFGQQQYPEVVSRLLGSQLLDMANRIPRLEPQLWTIGIAVNLYLLIAIARLRSRLRKKDTRPTHERVAGL